MFDILGDSTVSIMRTCIQEANHGYCPEDKLTGGTSTLLNVEKGMPYSETLSVESHFYESKHNPSVSLTPFRFQPRIHGRSHMVETPAVFVPGTMPEIPETLATDAVRNLGKLAAYAQANGEDTQVLQALLADAAGTEVDLSKITPVTDPSRTKPWALDDSPRCRHLNGGYNMMQNVSISLGNYQSGVNLRGHSVDYARVATVLRSVGTLLFGYEEWTALHLRDQQFRLHFHLNLGELPMVPSGAFLSPAVLRILQLAFIPQGQEKGVRALAVHDLLHSLSQKGYTAHRVPITVLNPDVQVAVSEMAAEERAKRILGPYLKPEVDHDISVPTSSLSSFALLPKPPSDKLARTPRNATFRLLTPWLKVVLSKQDWPHQVAHLISEDNSAEAGRVLSENLDPRLPRLAFQIVRTHTPLARDVWKVFLRWLFIDSGRVPRFGTHDIASCYFASLKVNPQVLLSVYTTSYYRALEITTHFTPQDLLVSPDLGALESVLHLRKALYSRVARAYGRRYGARARMLQSRISGIDKTHKKSGHKRLSPELKKRRQVLVDEVVKFQWRSKVYPRLAPVAESGHAYDEGVYLDCVLESITNHCRKRRKEPLLNAVTMHLASFRQRGFPLKEILARLASMVKFNLVLQHHDIMERREMTLNDIDSFIIYDTRLHVHEDELPLQPRAAEDHADLDPYPSGSDWEGDGSDEDEGGLLWESSSQVAEASFQRYLQRRGQMPDNFGALIGGGFDTAAAVDDLLWEEELHNEGYGPNWRERVMTEFSLHPGDKVTISEMQGILEWVKRVWRPVLTDNLARKYADSPDVA